MGPFVHNTKVTLLPMERSRVEFSLDQTSEYVPQKLFLISRNDETCLNNQWFPSIQTHKHTFNWSIESFICHLDEKEVKITVIRLRSAHNKYLTAEKTGISMQKVQNSTIENRLTWEWYFRKSCSKQNRRRWLGTMDRWETTWNWKRKNQSSKFSRKVSSQQ